MPAGPTAMPWSDGAFLWRETVSPVRGYRGNPSPRHSRDPVEMALTSIGSPPPEGLFVHFEFEQWTVASILSQSGP